MDTTFLASLSWWRPTGQLPSPRVQTRPCGFVPSRRSRGPVSPPMQLCSPLGDNFDAYRKAARPRFPTAQPPHPWATGF